jgi:hypothetical protein
MLKCCPLTECSSKAVKTIVIARNITTKREEQMVVVKINQEENYLKFISMFITRIFKQLLIARLTIKTIYIKTKK